MAERQPVIGPMYERRDFSKVMLELAKRLGIQDKYYEAIRNSAPIRRCGCGLGIVRRSHAPTAGTRRLDRIHLPYAVRSMKPGRELESGLGFPAFAEIP